MKIQVISSRQPEFCTAEILAQIKLKVQIIVDKRDQLLKNNFRTIFSTIDSFRKIKIEIKCITTSSAENITFDGKMRIFVVNSNKINMHTVFYYSQVILHMLFNLSYFSCGKNRFLFFIFMLLSDLYIAALNRVKSSISVHKEECFHR